MTTKPFPFKNCIFSFRNVSSVTRLVNLLLFFYHYHSELINDNLHILHTIDMTVPKYFIEVGKQTKEFVAYILHDIIKIVTGRGTMIVDD